VWGHNCVGIAGVTIAAASKPESDVCGVPASKQTDLGGRPIPTKEPGRGEIQKAKKKKKGKSPKGPRSFFQPALKKNKEAR